MTYFADGSRYTYSPSESEESLVNIGWLDGSMPFSSGEVARELMDVLREICRAGVNRMRGYHQCNLCAPSSSPVAAVRVASVNGDFFVGDAEIRITGSDGTRYASPNMIVHYVEAHGYRPPDDFLEAVAARAKPS